MLNILNPFLILNSYNIASKIENINQKNKETEIDIYKNNITHNRTKIDKETYPKYNNFFYRKKRKPNEIIVFTDGFSYSATSMLIKNLQESGNAIIVGYNGNPSKKKKNDKFDASQSPLPVRRFSDDIENNLKKYGILVYGITFAETFNDSYVNKNVTPIPREYLINPIDERSNIYGKYSDNRYDEFINEAKRIFKKYETECNIDNKNMVFLNNSCKFDDKKKIGGNKCINGKWDKNKCQVSHCNISYTFDTFKKECIGKTVKEQELENNKIFKEKFEEIEKKTKNIQNKAQKQKKNIEFEKSKIIYIIFIIVFSVLLIIAFIIIFILMCKKTNKNGVETVLEAKLISITDQN